MSTFNIHDDAPGLLRAESINITLKFDRTGPTTGRISWNIPAPAAGCTAETQAYCGMVVTIDTTPVGPTKKPVKGQVYSSDPSTDANLFSGDKIDTSMVVGAFYQDRTTTFFDVTDLKANTPYYVSGFPVDCQLRYFIEGVHAYSLDATTAHGTGDTHGTQVAVLNTNQQEMGVQLSDPTGLELGETYEFQIKLGVVPAPNRPLDAVDCKLDTQWYTISILGDSAQTYEDLVEAIQREFDRLSASVQGPNPPNAGGYYWNNQTRKLFSWDGYTHTELTVIYDTTEPTLVAVGSYWLNTTTNVLATWDGVAWTPVLLVEHATDPTQPTADASYWFDGTTAYVWNGNTWCEVQTFVRPTNPSLAQVPAGGSFWYNTTTQMLYRWRADLSAWVAVDAVVYDVDVNALPSGTYWLNDSTNTLSVYESTTTVWTPQINVAISESAPTVPAPGKLWFNPASQELFQRNPTNTQWDELPVIVFPFDPTIRTSCGLWWNSATDVLHVWDALNMIWIPVLHLFQQATDPSAPPVMTDGAAWFDGTTLYVWDNSCFVPVSFVQHPTDPTLGFVDGNVWHNTTTDRWYVWTAPVGWVEIDIVASAADPTMLPVGTFWYNPSNAALQVWNGASWMTVMYSTTPLNPAPGTTWFNSTTGTVMRWNGTAWEKSTPIATVELDCNGNLLFTDMNPGSLSFVRLKDLTLFEALDATYRFHEPDPGTDGVSDTPSYAEQGIGTTGDDQFREKLANEIRYELGYPTMTVELTKEQLDYAISKAISELRMHASSAYERGFFFMAMKPNEQKYLLTNKIQGMNKIVDILGVYRLTSSFLSNAHGSGVYGQIMVQHLYNQGSFDLLSYHLMAEYTNLMEMLFAARITFTWSEHRRELFIHKRFTYAEPRVAIEAMVERTEQDLISDRYLGPWIRRYAAAQARLILAETRGKYGSLPGASGTITLNADTLRQYANEQITVCMDEIFKYEVDRPENVGMGSSFLFG